MLTRVDAVNTSANDDDFGRELSVGGQQVGGTTTTVAAATTKEIDVVSFSVIDPAKPSTLSAKAAPPRPST